MLPIIAETRRILIYLQNMPYVNTSRGLVIGESFGGLGAIATASSDIKAIRGVINISGGDGGSLEHLEQPCRPDQLRNVFAHYGATNLMPTLWMYSVNDRFWGNEYPRQWFEDFINAGGTGTFVSLPADKNNGHYIFTRNPPAWHPAFESFIHRLGF